MEKLREEDRKAGFKERMKITQLLIIKKANRAEHFTCSTKILAWSAQPSKRTWLATSSTFQRMIFWRSLDTAAWLLWLMEVLSSLRNADGNPLPSGHGNEKGETCWMPLSSTRKEQYERKNEALYYYELRRLFIIHWFTKGTYHLHKKTRKFRLKNKMLCAIPVRMLQKTLAVIWGNVILLLLCSESFFHHGNSIALLYMCNVSTWVVYVNGKHPNSQKVMIVWVPVEK